MFNINAILKEVNENYSTRIYGTESELQEIMKQLKPHWETISYGMEENHTGIFVDIVKLEEE